MQMFKVDESVAVRVAPEPLRALVARLFERVGVSPEDAALGADHLVRADLRGVESHGVSNMLRRYLGWFRDGTLNPRPNWRVVREAPATANVDADRGLGIMVAPKAMEIAIRKARDTGVGMATIQNSGHAGMVSYMAMMALPHDMIGLCTTAGGAIAVPTFGREPRLGTNPISFAAPADQEAPFVFDAATTVIAGNQVQLARRQGKLLRAGVVADEDGRPIMEPAPAPGQYMRMLPLGTLREMGSHKGYGLSCIVEILGALLSGLPTYTLRPNANMSSFVAAIDIAAFCPVADYKRNMDDFLGTLRTTPPAAGHDRVYYAGLQEAEHEQKRAHQGIPLHPEVIAWFDSICDELGVGPKLEPIG